MLYESTYYGVMPLGDTIKHSGVKGMKWYKRRWQNLDGSLTPAGRVHYGVGGPRKARTDKDKSVLRKTSDGTKVSSALKDATKFNVDKWGTDEDHNILYITGYSGSGKSTAARAVADENTDVIHLDVYLEPWLDSDETKIYPCKQLDNYLKKNGVPYEKLRDGSFNDENGRPYNNKEWWALLDKFQASVEDFGKEQYKNGRKVVLEGVALSDETMYSDKTVLKGKPMAIMDTGAVKSTLRATKRDIGDDFKLSDIPSMLGIMYRKATSDSKTMADLKKILGSTAAGALQQTQNSKSNVRDLTSKQLLDLLNANSKIKDPNTVSDKEMDHSKSDNRARNVAIAELVLSTMVLRPDLALKRVKRLAESASANKAEKTEEKRRNTLEVDEKTGFHKKSGESSPDDDMKAINPAYNNLNTNTKANCMLCSTAYELRRRGYDVQANKASTGFDVKLITRWFPDAKWVATDKGPIINRDKSSPNYATDTHNLRVAFAKASSGENRDNARKTIAELEKQPNGSRGNIVISWGGGGAHSMVYEIENGKAVIRDCQANITYRNPEEILRYSITTQYCRTDNLKFDEKRIKEAVR